MHAKASSSVGRFFVKLVNNWLDWSMLSTTPLSSRLTKLKRSEESETVPSVPDASLMMSLLIVTPATVSSVVGTLGGVVADI